MLTGAISTALGGMLAATQKLEDAAHKIVLPTSIDGARADTPPVMGSTPTGRLDDATASSLAGFSSDNLTQGVLDLKLAEISYKASLKVFDTANKMFDALLDVTS